METKPQKMRAPFRQKPHPQKMTKKYRYRSSITGNFCTRQYALDNPDTTMRESYSVLLK